MWCVSNVSFELEETHYFSMWFLQFSPLSLYGISLIVCVQMWVEPKTSKIPIFHSIQLVFREMLNETSNFGFVQNLVFEFLDRIRLKKKYNNCNYPIWTRTISGCHRTVFLDFAFDTHSNSIHRVDSCGAFQAETNEKY